MDGAIADTIQAAPYHLAEARYTDEGLPHTLQPGTLLLSQDYRQLSGPWRRDYDNQYRTSDEARTGRYSWAVESASGYENGCQYMISTDVTDEAADHPGATIVFSAWVKAPTGHERPSIQLKYKAGGQWYYPSQDVYTATGQWQRLEVRLDLSTITDLQNITPIARHTGTKGVPAYFDDLRVYAMGGSGDAPSGAEIRYRYSAEGQRTYTQVGTGAPTFTVRGGAAALGQLRGPADSGGDPSMDYYNVLLPSGTPIGRFVGGFDSERRYYHTDHLGSTRAVTDQSGQVVERRDHYPFGFQMPGRTLAQGPRANEDYTGHELDPETGMHYAGARFYMSALGRWGTIDPVAGLYPGHSPYNYVLNNPLSFFDGTGMCPEGIEHGETFDTDRGPTLCYNPEEGYAVTAERGDDAGISGNTFFFNSSTKKGRTAFRRHLRDNPGAARQVIGSSRFSPAVQQIAMEESIYSAQRRFMRTTLRIAQESGADLAMTVSILSGGGTVVGVGGLLLRRGALSTAGRQGAIRLANMSSRVGLYASGTEAGLRLSAVPVGGSKSEAGYAVAGAFANGILSTPVVRGVSATGLSGPAFRNNSTGQFVTNSYGIGRFSTVQGTGAALTFTMPTLDSN